MVCWSYESAHIVCFSIEEKGSTTIASALYYPLVLSLSLSCTPQHINVLPYKNRGRDTMVQLAHRVCVVCGRALVSFVHVCARALRNGIVLHCARERERKTTIRSTRRTLGSSLWAQART